MINFDDVTKKKKKHNPNWSETPDHLYRILIIGGQLWIWKNKFVI